LTSSPASLHFRFLSLPPAPLLCSARPHRAVLAAARSGRRTCGACRGSVQRKDNMSASTSSPLAGEEKQEAALVRHYKGINDLDKVMLREVQGSSAKAPVCHSHKSSGMFWLPDPSPDPCRLPWCRSKPKFLVPG
jgi:hypothetical protein